MCVFKVLGRVDGVLGRRFAGAERGSRGSQGHLNPRCERVRAAEHPPRDPRRVLERRHCLAEIVERGAVVIVERHRVNLLHPEREIIILSEDGDDPARHLINGRRFSETQSHLRDQKKRQEKTADH